MGRRMLLKTKRELADLPNYDEEGKDEKGGREGKKDGNQRSFRKIVKGNKVLLDCK